MNERVVLQLATTYLISCYFNSRETKLSSNNFVSHTDSLMLERSIIIPASNRITFLFGKNCIQFTA